jgi:lipid II:glycine glycyltransferase (peptidoglycan interpeptide bridge formation enzyme)
MLKRINRAIKHGVTTKTVETEEEFKAFMKLLRHHHWLKPRRYVPTDHFFRSMMDKNRCTLFISQYNHHVLGCSCLVYAEGDAYLWYSASRRKSFATLHPNAVTYWNTIKYAYDKGCQHIRFMDVGLPFRRNIYRDFILRFGGKEVSTFRWFRISLRWVNKLASWLWRE